MGPPGRRRQSVPSSRLSRLSRGQWFRGLADRMGACPCPPRERVRTPRRRRARLLQEPLDGRVRLRPGPCRRLRTGPVAATTRNSSLPSPSTPVTGPRLLVAGGDAAQRTMLQECLASAIVRLAGNAGGILGPRQLPSPAANAHRSSRVGFVQRSGIQFHWENRGYGTFEDFLASLSSRKAQGHPPGTPRGGRQRRHHSQAQRRQPDRRRMERLLRLLPGHRRPQVGNPLPDPRVLRPGSATACGTMSSWSCAGGTAAGSPARSTSSVSRRCSDATGAVSRDHRMLHFECCYYQAIAYAIENGLSRVEAGAQGGHKIQRGYHAGHHVFLALVRPQRHARGRRKSLRTGRLTRRRAGRLHRTRDVALPPGLTCGSHSHASTGAGAGHSGRTGPGELRRVQGAHGSLGPGSGRFRSRDRITQGPADAHIDWNSGNRLMAAVIRS